MSDLIVSTAARESPAVSEADLDTDELKDQASEPLKQGLPTTDDDARPVSRFKRQVATSRQVITNSSSESGDGGSGISKIDWESLPARFRRPTAPPLPPPQLGWEGREYSSRYRSTGTARLWDSQASQPPIQPRPTQSDSSVKAKPSLRRKTRSATKNKIEEAHTLTELSLNLIPRVNCMGWTDFTASQLLHDVESPRYEAAGIPRRRIPKKKELRMDICAIDVLVGEPNITLGIKADSVMRDRESTQPVPSELLGTKREGETINSGLKFRMRSPERIRLSSPYLINILLNDASHHFVTIIRPFRILLDKEEKIRTFYRQLELEGSKPLTYPPTIITQRKTQDFVIATEISSDATALEMVGCLVQLMDEYILPRVQFVREFDCTRIYFDDLWYLFRPGDHVFRLSNATTEADVAVMRVISVQGVEHRVRRHRVRRHRVKHDSEGGSEPQQSPFEVHCVTIDFDGKQLGPQITHYAIHYFEGEKAVRSLPIMPINRVKDEQVQKQLVHNGINLNGCQDDGEIIRKLVERGKSFFNMTVVKHMHFNGTTVFGEQLDCPVMIDFEQTFMSDEAQGYWKDGHRYPGWKPDLKSLVDWTPPLDAETYSSCQFECCRNHNVYLDRYLDRTNSVAYLDSLTGGVNPNMYSLAIHPRYRDEADVEENRIKDDEFLIMAFQVYGFVFQMRKFRPLGVSQITPVRDSSLDPTDGNGQRRDREEVFDQLVLPLGHKDMIKSLISQHFKDKLAPPGKQDSWDVVRGKGKGLVILLHGAPGVGKTTTAECVADYFRKPLFQLTCGDLGMWAQQVESALHGTFTLAGRWGCILLLDEADVFLAARTPTDLLRNSIVSVFLRVIEYYSGVLFLTTNRVGDFDEAFASRIHMSLYYPPLDLEATISVFVLNMDRLQRRLKGKNVELVINKSSIIAYATDHWYVHPGARWNGRQIRNACQTALALAEFEAQGGDHDAAVDPNAVVSLEVKHFKTVANSYLGFMSYLTDIYGVNLDERAKENFVRADVRSAQVTSSPNPLLSRKHDTRPSPHQIFDRPPRTWNPLNPSAQTAGINPQFQSPYFEPRETAFQTNIARPPTYTQYAPSQVPIQQTPTSSFAQGPFAAEVRFQGSSYSQNVQGGPPQIVEPAQQIPQTHQAQYTQTASPQITDSIIQPNPLTTTGESSQYPNCPTAPQVWTQSQGSTSASSSGLGGAQNTNVYTTRRVA